MQGPAEGFPLAVYLFIGWKNSAALAEESENTRRDVVYLAADIALLFYCRRYRPTGMSARDDLQDHPSSRDLECLPCRTLRVSSGPTRRRR